MVNIWKIYGLSLVGGDWNMTGLFSHIFGILIPVDVHIFQRGSNHQLDVVINHENGTWTIHR